MQALIPPFVWSLRFSTNAIDHEPLHFEQYATYFKVDKEEDRAELSLLTLCSAQRISLHTLLVDLSLSRTTHEQQSSATSRYIVPPVQLTALLALLDQYVDTLLTVFAFSSTSSFSSTGSTSSLFSMSSVLSAANNAATDDRVAQRPGVAWSSTLQSTNESWSGDLSLEIVAVLANKAVALILQATTGSEGLTKTMIPVLQHAAGIYDWIGSAKLQARAGMPEASQAVVFAMSAACRGVSQQIAVHYFFTNHGHKHLMLAGLW